MLDEKRGTARSPRNEVEWAVPAGSRSLVFWKAISQNKIPSEGDRVLQRPQPLLHIISYPQPVNILFDTLYPMGVY